MQLSPALRIGVLIAAVCPFIHGQSTQRTDSQIESKGMPARATPSDYQAHAQVGAVTIAAEFKGHSIPTLQGTLSTADYVVIEAGLFGSHGAAIKILTVILSLRINVKKNR